MSAPKRIQRRRTKGWRMPDGAVYVGRPSRWGNPWTIHDARENGRVGTDAELAAMCVAEYRAWLRNPESTWWYGRERARRIMAEIASLRGRDLVCWCPLEDADGNPVPCHADVLLELANTPEATS